MNTSRKKYRRSLQLSGMIRLVLLGAIAAGVSCAFVVVKNRQHSLANAKGSMEAQIVQLDRRIEILDLRIAEMVDRKVLASRLAGDMADLGLRGIEHAETVVSGPLGPLGSHRGGQFVTYHRGREEDWASGRSRIFQTIE